MAASDTVEEAQVEAFNEALDDFLRATRRARGRLAAEGSRGPLSLSQYHHLEPLERAGGALSVGEVAVQAGVARPTATRMLDLLERDGLVVRARPEGDRRIVHACITDEGRRAVRAKRAQIDESRREVFASLAPGERRHAARVLSSLAAAVEELR